MCCCKTVFMGLCGKGYIPYGASNCIPGSCHKVRAGLTAAASICTGDAAAGGRAELHIWTRLKSWTSLFQPTQRDLLLCDGDCCIWLCLLDNKNNRHPLQNNSHLGLLSLPIHFRFILLLSRTIHMLLPLFLFHWTHFFPFTPNEPPNWNLKVAGPILQVFNPPI